MVVIAAVGTPLLVHQLRLVEVPNLHLVSAAHADSELKALGLRVALPDWYHGGADAQYVVVRQTPLAGQHLDPTSTVKLSLGVVVPDLSNWTASAARSALSSLGLSVSFSDERASEYGEFFAIVSTLPLAGAIVNHDDAIALSTEATMVVVPEVSSKTFQDATDELKAHGFRGEAGDTPVVPPGLVATSDEVKSAFANHDLWLVDSQSVPAASIEQAGSVVTLKLRPPVVTVPSLIGLKPSDVTSKLQALGLNSNAATIEPSWTVQSQSPPAGAYVLNGASINVTAAAPQIVYSVTGNGSRAVITWIPPGTFSIQQNTNARVPWSVSFEDDGESSGNFSAQMLNGSSITCSITVDGNVVQSNTSTGRYSVVSCG